MTSATPNFGALLVPVLSRVPGAVRPRFLALLERTAADRYRTWATELPDESAGLAGCAAREDEIADRIEALFDIDESALAGLRALLPESRALYYAAFDGLPVADQLRMQADAELQGANAWRSIAQSFTDKTMVAELHLCAAIEEASSHAVGDILTRLAH